MKANLFFVESKKACVFQKTFLFVWFFLNTNPGII